MCKDDALRYPETEMVTLIASLAASTPLGVLSNCHEREVRCRAGQADASVDTIDQLEMVLIGLVDPGDE